MRIPRVIPSLLLNERGLYKTKRFRAPTYVGDPINVVKILNDKQADEILLLDIGASRRGSQPDFDYLKEVVSEAFMPVGYGGGIRSFEDAKRLFELGIEKVSFNTAFHRTPEVITKVAEVYGSQAVMVSLDVKRTLFGKLQVRHTGLSHAASLSFEDALKRAEEIGAGEIVITDIDREGMYSGYNLEILSKARSLVSVPVVANGGAASPDDFVRAVASGASAVAAGSLFVFAGAGKGVLISYPGYAFIEKLFQNH